ncbi:YeeE/YedE thiosulfate transporter family protein [Sulfurimonas sp. C5]|uniref:YeeE/YedE thiosulfate transporter family protein n=1 Tax=Sulfurimonas sp. C5 TaxID=3036947 RepID=UPI0024569C71|nr:YeeE/YedE thiosulfate transporter family protein [Sulfurimonas sp. C5]MDH4943815.1 YeeE/YedE thiosulfate transporter family protein [Sulfurimonas sp. C5]
MPRYIPWWVGGIMMSILFIFTFSEWGADRPIGASTGMAYLSTILFGLDESKYEYVEQIKTVGSWEAVMLIGVFIGGLFTSLVLTKSFRISCIPTLWKERKNTSVKSRMFWSFIGGFLLVFGARLAGGCNAGHVLSGGSQMAVSGFVFTIVALGTGMLFGRFFYKKKVKKDV